jgi:hypothetical protein
MFKMRYFNLFKKKIGLDISKKFEKILEDTIFKNQYVINNKKLPLTVLRKEANDSFLPVY